MDTRTMEYYLAVVREGNISAAAEALHVAQPSLSRQMKELDKLYPEYGFARNKGYGTKEHTDALKRIGPCPEHRRSFITHFV